MKIILALMNGSVALGMVQVCERGGSQKWLLESPAWLLGPAVPSPKRRSGREHGVNGSRHEGWDRAVSRPREEVSRPSDRQVWTGDQFGGLGPRAAVNRVPG